MTRSQKKPIARAAVLAALRRYPASEFMAHSSFDGVLERAVSLIEEGELAKGNVSLDQRDISLATRWLHFKGIVRVAHYDPNGNPHHSITMRRSY